MKRDSAAPATKGDISELRTENRARFDGIDQRFDGIDQKINHMSDDIRRLMSASVDTNEKMQALESRLTARMDALDVRIVAKLESFTNKMETLWRESIVYPRLRPSA